MAFPWSPRWMRLPPPEPIPALAPKAGSPGDADDYWYQPFVAASATGLNVTADAAMRLSAVYRCVRILAGTVAKLPLKIYRTRKEGGKEEADDHPLYEVLHDSPNSWQTSFDFREMMQAHLALRGNAIAQIIPGPRGAVDQLYPIHPDRVRIQRLENGRLRYNVTMPDGTIKPFAQDQMFHVRGLSFDGVRGLNPIEYQRESLRRDPEIQLGSGGRSSNAT